MQYKNGSVFTLQCPLDYKNGDKVPVIKAIRMLTGFGLKEAKDVSEIQTVQYLKLSLGNFASCVNKDVEIENQFRVLRVTGCQVGGAIHLLLQSLRDLGAEALTQGEDELANEILQLVLVEKLRRNNS